MSYSSEITYPSKKNGRITVRILEKEARDTSETDAINVPKKGQIVRYSSRLISGSGSVVDPQMGRKVGWVASTEDETLASSSSAPAAFISERDPVPYFAPKGKLYLRSGVDDATEDHTIITEIEIIAGVA